jgi:sodium-dependent dicarboxylate transporter 2/3/5
MSSSCLIFAVGLWITEAIPAFAVSLFIMAYLVFALGNKNFNSEPESVRIYVQTFSDSIIWLLLGGYFPCQGNGQNQTG